MYIRTVGSLNMVGRMVVAGCCTVVADMVVADTFVGSGCTIAAGTELGCSSAGHI